MPNQTMQGLAGILAEQGRYGDTMLMHVAPSEVKYLADLGGITENPMTGLPEAFKFKDLLPFVGSAFLGPAFKAVGFSPGVSSFLASTASTMIGGGSLEKGIMSGLVSSSLGRLGRNLAATSPDAAVDAATGQPIADTGYKFGIFKKPETGTFGSRYSEAFKSPEFNPIEMAKVATEGGLDNFMEQIQKPGVLLPLTTGLGELGRIKAEEDYIRQYQNFLTSQAERRKRLQTKYPQILPPSNPYYQPTGMAQGGEVQRQFDGGDFYFGNMDFSALQSFLENQGLMQDTAPASMGVIGQEPVYQGYSEPAAIYSEPVVDREAEMMAAREVELVRQREQAAAEAEAARMAAMQREAEIQRAAAEAAAAERERQVREVELARQAEAARIAQQEAETRRQAEQARQEAERVAAEQRRIEAERQAEAQRQAQLEAQRQAELQRAAQLAEEARQAEIARQQEFARQEEIRQAEAARVAAEAEAARIAEAERVAQQAVAATMPVQEEISGRLPVTLPEEVGPSPEVNIPQPMPTRREEPVGILTPVPEEPIYTAPATTPVPEEPVYNPIVTPLDSQPAPVDVGSFFVPGADVPESTGFNDQALYELGALLSQPKTGGEVDVARNFAVGPISVDPNVSATVYKPIGQPTVEEPPQQTLADYGLTQAEADAIAANMKPLYSGVDTAAMEANFLAGLSPEELKGVEQMNEYSSFLKNRFDDIRQALAAKDFEKAFDLAISGDKQYIEKFNPGEMTQGIFTANMMRTSDISQMAGPMTEDDIRAYYEAMPVDKVIPLLYPGAKVGDYIYTIDKNAAMQKDIAALKASGGVGYPTAADQVGMKSTKQNLTIPLITVALAFAGVPFALGDAVASSSIGAKLGLAGLGKAGTTALGSAIIGASGSALQGGSFEDALKAGLIAGGLSFIAETALGGIKDAYNNWALDNLPLGEQVNNTLVTVADPNTVIVSAVNQANSIAQATTQAAAQVAAQQATQPEVKVTTGKETVQPSAPVPTTVTPPAEPLVQTPLDQVTVRTGPETAQQPNAPVVVPPPAPPPSVVQPPLDQVTVRTGPDKGEVNAPVNLPPAAIEQPVIQTPLDQVTVTTGPDKAEVNAPVVQPPPTPVELAAPVEQVTVTTPQTPPQKPDVPVVVPPPAPPPVIQTPLDQVTVTTSPDKSDVNLPTPTLPPPTAVELAAPVEQVTVTTKPRADGELNVPTPTVPTTTPFTPPTAPTPINTPDILETLKDKTQEVLTDAALAQLLAALAGGGAGTGTASVGTGGGYAGTGGLGYIPEGQERKYFGAPGDYRHGFLPEWMFFTNLNPPAVIDTTQPGATPGGSPGTRPGTTPDDRIEPKAVGGTIKSYSPRGYLEMIQGYNEGGEIEETMMEDSDAPMTDGSRQLIPLTQAAILGQLPEDQTDDVIQKFIDLHGNRAFRKLREETLESVANGSRKEGMVEGHTGGMDDMVDGVIGSSERVAVSPGEFIIPADVVSMLGDGNSDSGRHKLEQMMSRVRKDKTGSTKQARPINSAKVLPA